MSTPKTVTGAFVDRVLGDSDLIVKKMGRKTTVVHATLPNGFEVVGVSACSDPSEYNMAQGQKIAMEDARRQVWAHIGSQAHANLLATYRG